MEPFYKLMVVCSQSKEFPPIEDIFPIFSTAELPDDPTHNPDDDILFAQCALVQGAK